MEERQEQQSPSLEEFIKQILEDAYNDEEMRESLNKVLRRYGYEVKANPIEEVVKKKISKVEEENRKLKEEIERKKREELMEQYKRTLQKYGLSEEDMNKVVEFAKQQGIMNFETACRLYVIDNKVLKPQYTYRGIVNEEQPLIEKYKGIQGKENLIKDAFDILAKIS
ncbi:MAG: hypothetical protein QXJ28_03450 [Candidatus Pacearchaeota archaeon]